MGADNVLEDLRGSLVDRRDPHIAADLLDLILVGVALAAVGLNGGVSGGVARLGGEILRHRALDLEPELRTEHLLNQLDRKLVIGVEVEPGLPCRGGVRSPS